MTLHFLYDAHMSHGEGNGTPLQYSCLENPMGEGAWKAAVHGSRGVRHDWATPLSLFTFMYWRRKWQPTPVFLSGESQGWGSLVGCCLWGRTESDTTEATPVQPSTDPCSLGYLCISQYQVPEPASLTFSNRISHSFLCAASRSCACHYWSTHHFEILCFHVLVSC